MYSSYSRWSGVLKSSRAMTKMDANPPRGAANSQAGTGPLLLSAQSTGQAVRGKLRAGLRLRGTPLLKKQQSSERSVKESTQMCIHHGVKITITRWLCIVGLCKADGHNASCPPTRVDQSYCDSKLLRLELIHHAERERMRLQENNY